MKNKYYPNQKSVQITKWINEKSQFYLLEVLPNFRALRNVIDCLEKKNVDTRARLFKTRRWANYNPRHPLRSPKIEEIISIGFLNSRNNYQMTPLLGRSFQRDWWWIKWCRAQYASFESSLSNWKPLLKGMQCCRTKIMFAINPLDLKKKSNVPNKRVLKVQILRRWNCKWGLRLDRWVQQLNKLSRMATKYLKL